MSVPKDYEEFFALLKKEKVKYLIVGAYALAYHGFPRFTGDIDIFISNERSNVVKVFSAIEKFGFKGIGITEPASLNRNRYYSLVIRRCE